MESMDILGWFLVVSLLVIGMLGAIYPLLPGVLAIYAAFFIYGLFFGWSPFGIWFWTIQTFVVVIVFIADYAASALGVKKFGGSRASVIGSTIGIILGPFVIPVMGLVLGPLIGAVIGERLNGQTWEASLKAGIGAIVGLFSSMIVKILLQLMMIVVFVVWLL
jgi:uncharacterized protein YqgC (DUF456 family)